MARGRAFTRNLSHKKALRKKRIAEEIYFDSKEHPYYDNLHQYSKNKIHCSCPLCSSKTRNKGRRKRKNYNPSLNYSHSDIIKIESMEFSESEYQEKEEI